MSQSRVDVIAANCNAGHLLRGCLESFATIARDDVTLGKIIIVDNGSQDGSLAALEDLFDKLPLKVVRNSENRSFTAACNQGAAASTADFLLVFNPDTRLTAGAPSTNTRRNDRSKSRP
jgi:N-acetylglucosaminyl-diphospho-decaprenol L-rhamnosyltransferase